MEYTLTKDEIQAVGFARGRYDWADLCYWNIEENVLRLNNEDQHDMNEFIYEQGLALLDPRCGLYQFLISLDPV